MRVISLLQPWATLWVAGAKLIETRSWGTDYRGRVAVHASKGFDREIRTICQLDPFAPVLRALGFASGDELPRGAVLGWVDLIGCLDMVDHRPNLGMRAMCIHCDPRLTAQERSFGNYAAGRVAWMTGRERSILATPLQMRGGLGLRELDPATAARLA